jgi:signal peptidase II
MALIPSQAAVRSPRARWAAAAIIAAVVAADQVTKSLVLAGRIAGGTGWAAVRLVRNTGSAGGLESGHPVLVSLVALAITGVAVVALLRARRAVVTVALSLVVAGALGNLADRLFRAPGLGRGAVVDWIHLAGGGGSMNISDLAINAGAIGLVIALLASREKRAPSRGAAREEEPPGGAAREPAG